MALSLSDRTLYSCTAEGTLQGWNKEFKNVANWMGHIGIALSSFIATNNNVGEEPVLITGGSDGNIKLWELVRRGGSNMKAQDEAVTHENLLSSNDSLLKALSDFVALRSVSSFEKGQECRQTAVWLTKHFVQLGAEAATLSSLEDETNPIVVATFKGREIHKKKRVLFYGHYDVVPASSEGWDSCPFTMSARNGYFYGRGVSDNKGPLLAFAHTASKLLALHQLNVDLVMLIEGEEETGSKGLTHAIRRHRDLLGHIDAIIISNSYWIGENTPCITYGLRGVIHAKITVSSDKPDLHSGMEGGAAPEAMQDLIQLLARLNPGGKISVPEFYDAVRPLNQEEKDLYDKLGKVSGRSAGSLIARWREPSLTVHSIEVSGPKSAAVIPSAVTADISVRIVPDQNLENVIKSLVGFLHSSFEALHSHHQLTVAIERTADWWLGDIDGTWFKALENAIESVWKEKPLRIREGGSIHSIPMLDKEFRCPILHLPMGQSSDQAHLHNERISMIHLLNGKKVAGTLLRDIGNWESGKI